MERASISSLPAPPAGKSGWPWTIGSDPLPESMPDGRPWPRISVVTPSFNQAPFLEATLRSVLLQGYPNLEYFVVDAASTDESPAILHRYEPWLEGWVSEPDRGQSDGVNKGFARATGEIFGWLNSDDLYQRDALARVASHFAAAPDCALLYGGGSTIDALGNRLGRCDWIRPFNRRLLLTTNFILQPSTFWRRTLWEQAGELDIASEWAMDWEWLLRATAVGRADHVPDELALWRIYPDIKTERGGQRRREEIAAISRRYGGFWQPTHLVYLWDRAAWRLEERLGRGAAFRFLKLVTAPVGWSLKSWIWKGRYLN
jgi:glycosyltransferase involved in cell wall biosynthesis